MSVRTVHPHRCARGPNISQDDQMRLVLRAEAKQPVQRLTSTKPPSDRLGKLTYSRPICTNTSFEQPDTRRALGLWPVLNNIARNIPDHKSKVAFLEALYLPPQTDGEKIAYGVQTAGLLGLADHELTTQQITANPTRLYAQTLTALKAYASSHRWWVGQSPERPSPEALGLHGELAVKLNRTLDFISRYRMLQFERNKDYAIGGAITLAGVAIGFGSFYFANRALAQGTIKAEGFLWDQTLGRYITTNPEEWYTTPLYYFVRHGQARPVYPATPADYANGFIASGCIVGGSLVIYGVTYLYKSYTWVSFCTADLNRQSPSRTILEMVKTLPLGSILSG